MTHEPPSFEAAWAAVPARGWLTEAEGRLLYRAAAETAGPLLEVGCYHGRSSALLAALGRPLHCVDPFRDFDTADPSGEATLAGWRAVMAERGHRVLEFPNQLGLIELAERTGAIRTMADRPAADVFLFRQRVEDWAPRPVGFAYLDGDHTFEGSVRQAEIAVACGARVIAAHDVNDGGLGRLVRDGMVKVLGPFAERVERLAVWRRG